MEEHKDTETMTDLFLFLTTTCQHLHTLLWDPLLLYPYRPPHTFPGDRGAARSQMCTCAIIAQQHCAILSPCSELGFGDKPVRS